jgi:hypothetical protein
MEAAAAYVKATHDRQAANVAITMRPEVWNTADFSGLTESLG